MPYPRHIAPEAPRIQQTLQLPVPKLESLQEWAIDGTAITASARVKDPTGRIALVKNSWTDGWFLPGRRFRALIGHRYCYRRIFGSGFRRIPASIVSFPAVFSRSHTRTASELFTIRPTVRAQPHIAQPTHGHTL
ncbi:hypothetical protein ACFQL7_21535 [Halocatena marina]|uniref:Uncharacterized protein n=1 Tax=Halocatena marina TaxID=2934937 RepID=A0ABD5YZ33_9EURY